MPEERFYLDDAIPRKVREDLHILETTRDDKLHEVLPARTESDDIIDGYLQTIYPNEIVPGNPTETIKKIALFSKRNGYVLMVRHDGNIYSLEHLDARVEHMIMVPRLNYAYKKQAKNFEVVPFNYTDQDLDPNKVCRTALLNRAKGSNKFLVIKPENVSVYTETFSLSGGLLEQHQIYPFTDLSGEVARFLAEKKAELERLLDCARRDTKKSLGFDLNFIQNNLPPTNTFKDLTLLLR